MDIDRKIFGIVLFIGFVLFISGCNEKTQQDMVLFDFETDHDLDQIHWECHTLFNLSDEHVTHGLKSLKMELFPSSYPGFDPALKQHDWGKYRFFQFDIYNPANKGIPITLRVDDHKDSNEYADRFNKTYMIDPGMNQMVIPLDSLVTSGTNRKLNLEEIYQFLLFSVDPPQKIVLYIDYIRLVSL